MEMLIDNCTVTRLDSCQGHYSRAAAFMPRPNFPSRAELYRSSLIYTPFLGRMILERSAEIFSIISKDGIVELVALEDCYTGEGSTHDCRFQDCSRVIFQDVDDFRNGGFDGRIILFSTNVNMFLYFDFLELSGIGCSRSNAEAILDSSLEEHFEDLRWKSSQARDIEEREYFASVVQHAKAIVGD